MKSILRPDGTPVTRTPSLRARLRAAEAQNAEWREWANGVAELILSNDALRWKFQFRYEDLPTLRQEYVLARQKEEAAKKEATKVPEISEVILGDLPDEPQTRKNKT